MKSIFALLFVVTTVVYGQENTSKDYVSLQNRKRVKINKPIENDGFADLEEIKSLCEENEDIKGRIVRHYDKSYNVMIFLKDIAFSGDYQYLYYEIYNNGNQTYDIDDINLFKITRTKNDISSYSLPVRYIHNPPIKIQSKSKHSFIAVIDKTSINKKMTITIEVKELNGERNLSLDIEDRMFNYIPVEIQNLKKRK